MFTLCIQYSFIETNYNILLWIGSVPPDCQQWTLASILLMITSKI